MSWILLALIAPILWGITFIFDKYLLEKHIPNIYFYMLISGFMGLLVLLGIPFYGFIIPKFNIMVLAIIGRFLYNYLTLPYFKAITLSELSSVVPIFQLTPVFTFILTILFIHVQYTIISLVALILLVLGGLLISIEHIDGVFKITKAFWYMLLSYAMYSIYMVLSKFIYLNVSYYTGLTWISIGGFLSVLPLLFSTSIRKETKSFITGTKLLVKSLVLLNEIINLLAILSIQLALVTGITPFINALVLFNHYS